MVKETVVKPLNYDDHADWLTDQLRLKADKATMVSMLFEERGVSYVPQAVAMIVYAEYTAKKSRSKPKKASSSDEEE